MRALILAAGVGSRLGSLTADIPKCLLSIAQERTMLELTLQTLKCNGIEDVTIVSGHGFGCLQTHLRVTAWEGRFRDFRYVYNPFYRELNNIASFAAASEAVATGESVILLNSDVVFDPYLLTRLLETGESSMLVDFGAKLGAEEMKVSCDEQGRIVAISKRQSVEESRGEYIGVSKFDPVTFRLLVSRARSWLESGRTSYYYEDVIDSVCRTGRLVVHAVPTEGRLWTEVDTPEDLSDARLIASEIWASGKASCGM